MIGARPSGRRPAKNNARLAAPGSPVFQSIQRSQIFEPAAASRDSGAIPCKVGLDFRAGRTDVRRLLVVPGLIDLHTHVYWVGPRWVLTRPK